MDGHFSEWMRDLIFIRVSKSINWGYYLQSNKKHNLYWKVNFAYLFFERFFLKYVYKTVSYAENVRK